MHTPPGPRRREHSGARPNLVYGVPHTDYPSMNSIIDMLWGARWMTNASSAFRAVRSRTTLHLTCQGKYTMM